MEEGKAGGGAVVLTCQGFGEYEVPRVFEDLGDLGDVLEYVVLEAGQVR